MEWKTTFTRQEEATVLSPASAVDISSTEADSHWAGILNWILTHRLSRLLVPPLILFALFACLAIPLLKDLDRLTEDDIVKIQGSQPGRPHDGSLIVNVKNVNPNNGIATLDITYVTDDVDKGNIELWVVSGGVSIKDGKHVYDVDAELHRVPIVMSSPTVFEWGETKRATYKEQDAEIKIEKRRQGYFYPFDRYDIEFSFSVIDRNQTTLSPALWCELEDPRFTHNRPARLRSHGEKIVAINNSLRVTLDRPIYQKIFLAVSMLMGLGCVVWSLYKITYTTIDAMESLSLLAFDFTVLLAVPSLRGVFVPSNLQFAPLFDFFVVTIWTVGLLALCVNIIRHDIVLRIRKMATGTASKKSKAGTDWDKNVEYPWNSGLSNDRPMTSTSKSLGIVGMVPHHADDQRHADHHTDSHLRSVSKADSIETRKTA